MSLILVAVSLNVEIVIDVLPHANDIAVCVPPLGGVNKYISECDIELYFPRHLVRTFSCSFLHFLYHLAAGGHALGHLCQELVWGRLACLDWQQICEQQSVQAKPWPDPILVLPGP
jgi:hypothetical protein